MGYCDEHAEITVGLRVGRECGMGESGCSRNPILFGGGGSKGDSMIGVTGLCDDAQVAGTCVLKLGMRGRPREDVRASMIDAFLER